MYVIIYTNIIIQPSTSSSLSVYGIDVHEKDISTLMPQSMVNDTIVNILFE